MAVCITCCYDVIKRQINLAQEIVRLCIPGFQSSDMAIAMYRLFKFTELMMYGSTQIPCMCVAVISTAYVFKQGARLYKATGLEER